ncbi:MAG: hypothetical protein K8R59_10740 [Thermoanaerobaculales bacterium]|nr:hypothetical protein [Thermoanaerobaculales bacterium]
MRHEYGPFGFRPPRRSTNDAESFDMVLDISTFGKDTTVALIHRALEAKGLV